MKFLSLLLVAVLMFGSVACTPPTTSQLVTGLNAVADASSAAVIVVGGLAILGRVPPGTVADVSKYSQAVNDAVTKTVVELKSTDTNPQKIATITIVFAGIAAPVISPQAAPQVRIVLDAVAAAVKFFLGELHDQKLLVAAQAAPRAKIVLAKGDKAMLKHIQAKAAENTVKAKALVQ